MSTSILKLAVQILINEVRHKSDFESQDDFNYMVLATLNSFAAFNSMMPDLFLMAIREENEQLYKILDKINKDWGEGK